jgi:hypothetical protein
MKSRAASAIVFREFTSEMLSKRLLLLSVFALSVASPLCFGQQTVPQAVLFKRYERGGGRNRIIEDTYSIKLDVKPEQKFTIALRVCSKQPLPFSLVTANAEPFFIADWLEDAYAYPRERLVFLRSEDCIGQDPRGVTEIWTLSQGASFPPHVEQLVATQAKIFPLGKKQTFRGVRDYREALASLIKELQANPAARGLVIGYYAHGKLSPKLQRRLTEVTRVFERSGLPPTRYLVHRAYWNWESSDDDPQPVYPEVFIIKKVD